MLQQPKSIVTNISIKNSFWTLHTVLNSITPRSSTDSVFSRSRVRIHHPSSPPLHSDPTNITLALMQEDSYFHEWRAQIARAHPVGNPQRCLLSFGGDMNPVPKAWNDFFHDHSADNFRLV